MSKIQLNDKVEDLVFKMSEGNPGAINVLLGMITQGAEIDPDNAFGGYGPIMMMDEWGIYGSSIYCLCNDCCGKDIVATLTMLRACQLGLYSADQLKKDIDGRGVNLMDKAAELIVKVQKISPSFNGGQMIGVKVSGSEFRNGRSGADEAGNTVAIDG